MDIGTFLINTADHLIGQTERSVDANGRCLYAGPNSNACGIGCHLPRGLAEELDRVTRSAGSWRSVVRMGLNPQNIHDLPGTHDTCARAVAVLDGIPTSLGQSVQIVHDTQPDRTPTAKRLMVHELILLAGDYDAGKACVDALNERQNELGGRAAEVF